MLRASTLSLMLLLPSLLAFVALSSSNSVEVLENRHTPGFPGTLNIESVEDLLHISSPEVRGVLEKLLECDSLECIEEVEISSRMLRSILYNSTGVNLTDLRIMVDSELLNMINDPSIRGLLESLNMTGNISPYEVDRLVNALEDARSRGSISTQAYMAALELLKRILERSGSSQSSLIERRQVETLREALIEASKKGLLSELIEMLSGLYRKSQMESFSSSIQRGGFKVEGPEVRFELPSVSPSIVVLVLLASLAVIALLNSQRLEALLGSMVISYAKPTEEFNNMPLILKLYWSSVRFIERVSGVSMDAFTTHREFLAKVRGRVGKLIEPFEGLTLSYELYRYAGFTERDVEEKALRYYDDMERLKRSRGS